MSKKLAIVLIVGAFLIGGFTGFITTNYYWTRFTNTFYSTSLAADIGTDTLLLNSLRTKKLTNAIDLLEVELDGSVIGLGVYLHNLPESSRDPMQLKILQQAKDYRSKFPRKNGFPLSDQMVSNAFSLVSMKTHK